jgi:c(7)-type cytochrome triheme protein
MTCRRCHGNEGQSNADYAALALPRGAFGEVDWEKAEAEGKVHPVDTFDGVSMPRPPLRMDRDVSFASQGAWMQDVRFSHKKHAIWNGCEVCHPDIFPSTRAGTVKFTMLEISGGRYCGACHGKVAFALAYCEKCHVKPVGMP